MDSLGWVRSPQLGEFYWDTTAEMGGGVGRSDSSLEKVQGELTDYRKRIDANAESQRRHAEVIAALQNKVLKYRQQVAELESQLQRSSVHGRESPDGRSPAHFANENISHSKHVLDQLKEEQRRCDNLEEMNDMLRMQADAALAANQSMSTDLVELNQRLQKKNEEVSDQKLFWRQQEMAYRRHVDEQHKRMLDLWTTFNRLRRQVNDVKLETEKDLERQKTELHRCVKSVGRVVQEVGRQRAPGVGFDASDHRSTVGLSGISRNDRNVTAADDLMRKYEEIAARNADCERERGENLRKIAELESALKKTQEQCDSSRDALKRITGLPELDDSTSVTRRTRSVSPGGVVNSSEAVRQVRGVLRVKTDEIKTLKRQLEDAQANAIELKKKLTTAEDSRRQTDRALLEAKSSAAEIERQKEEFERKVKRLEEKIARIDEDRIAAETARRNLEAQLRSAQTGAQQTSDDQLKKLREDAEATRRQLEADLAERQKDMQTTLARSRGEYERSQRQVAEIKERLRTVEIESTALSRKLNDRDAAIKELNEAKLALESKNAELQRDSDASSQLVVRLESNVEQAAKNQDKLNSALQELKSHKDTLSKEKEELSKANFSLKMQLDDKIAEVNEIRLIEKKMADEIAQYQTKIASHDRELAASKSEVVGLDSKLSTENDRFKSVQVELAAAKEEIEKNLQFINRLGKEKADITRERDSVENRLRECEVELARMTEKAERLTDENRGYYQQELHDRTQIEIFINKEHKTAEALADAKDEIKRLTDQLQRASADQQGRVEQLELEKRQLDSTLTEKHNIFIERQRVEVVRIGKEKAELEATIVDYKKAMTELEEGNLTLASEIERTTQELNDIRKQLSNEISKLKSELESTKKGWKIDTDDWQKEKEKLNASRSENEAQLRDALKRLEEDLSAARNEAKRLELERNDLEKKLRNALADVDRLQEQNDGNRDALERNTRSLQSDLDAFESRAKIAEAAASRAETDLRLAKDRIVQLESSLSDCERKLRGETARLHQIEQELSDAKGSQQTAEGDARDLRERLLVVEQQLKEIEDQRDSLRSQVNAALKDSAAVKAAKQALEDEHRQLQVKASELDATCKQYLEDIQRLERERISLSANLDVKTKQGDSLATVIAQYDEKLASLRREIQLGKEKWAEVQSQNTTLQSEKGRLQQDLDHAREKLDKKTETNRLALDELIANYRTAEKGRVDALRQMEAVNSDLEAVQSRLNIVEARAIAAEERLKQAEIAREQMSTKVRQMDSTARKALSLSRYRSPVRDGANQSLASVGLDMTDSTKFVSFNDQSSVEVAFQSLTDRIDGLEKEKNDVRAELLRTQQQAEKVQNDTKEKESRTEQLAQSIRDLDEEKRMMETRLASARQLLLSQEEAIRSRDEDRRQLKARLVTVDLHQRGKDARIQQLTDQLSALNVELTTAANEKRQYREAGEIWDAERMELEAKLREQDVELQRLRMQMSSVEASKQGMEDRLKDAEGQLKLSEQRCEAVQRNADRLREQLARYEADESHLKSRVDKLSRTAAESQSLQDQFAQMQRDLSAVGARKQAMESELEQARRDIGEWKSRVADLNGRISELQRNVNESAEEKKRLDERLSALDRDLRASRSSESALRRELEAARGEKTISAGELEDLRRRLNKLETERKEFAALQSRFQRERAALKKTIETLEMDKQRTDDAVRRTAMERQALDKSLTAMERENMELYKNCAQLQNQVSQLEQENGHRILELSNRQREEQEAHVGKVRGQKHQLEKLLDSREQMHTHQVKLLEDQVASLRNQLDAERKRRRDYVERSLKNDQDISHLRSGIDQSLANLRSETSSAGSFLRPNMSGLNSRAHLLSPMRPPVAHSTPFESPVKK